MATAANSSHTSPDDADLTIGDLAASVGVTPELLRTWEARHGFPTSERTPAGHRRFRASDISRVRDVLTLRDAGLGLEKAIARVVASASDEPPSVYAELRRTHPELHPQRLRAGSLVALSNAIEDESCALARRPVLIGAFQTGAFYRRSEQRWRELDRTALFTLAIADFGRAKPAVEEDGPRLVELGRREPMRREWAVVCVAEDFHATLAGWERPGQTGRGDAREFEAVWTTAPSVARAAARLCMGLSRTAQVPVPDEVLAFLGRDGGVSDAAAVESLAARAVGYLDRRLAGRR
jgi:MerR family transcriptional regulator, light-induced transcriptional regulator